MEDLSRIRDDGPSIEEDFSSAQVCRRDPLSRMLSFESSGGDMRPYVLRSSSSGGQEQLMTYSPTTSTCLGLERNPSITHQSISRQLPVYETPVVVSTQQSSRHHCPQMPSVTKNYDYTLKFLLVGDSDVGKEEILSGLDGDSSCEANEGEEGLYASVGVTSGVTFKSTVILLDGKKIRLQVWDTSGGQGRFSTIIRSYSRGAQGILLVYDITNKWSFNGLNRWLNEVEQDAPGIPKILLGNRLHLAFKRQVSEHSAESYAHKHNMSFFEVSPLCNFNVKESFTELARIVLQRHGMESLWRNSNVLSLQELCCRAIVAQTTFYGIERLPLPSGLKSFLRSYSTHDSIAGGLTIKPCFKIYNSSHSHSLVHNTSPFGSSREKDSTLKRKAKALFSCDSSTPSTSVTLGIPARSSRPVSRASNARTATSLDHCTNTSEQPMTSSTSNSRQTNRRRSHKKCTIS